ncbi:hypothetical protein LOTGIDRAFT_231585 [Lottia gigantea]|uniref:L-dopachrome isomerase n=1 Tax=Lottia gigantea TaxID=225164 RepID=V4AUH7_LOTGI|nr:hypothetical protein LOTGIDRAFT_231585 [Lottia gigantea]ESO97416.1 hypothetical protein LOTGIDRAFT_231585 [Lottia gigantea]
MPMFILYTNLPSANLPSDFLTETSKIVATALNKPESFVAVRIHCDVKMIHAGSDELCGSAELQSIGALGVEENKVLSCTLAEHLEKTLGLKPDRYYIKFTDMQRSEVGFKKTTFDELLGKK